MTSPPTLSGKRQHPILPNEQVPSQKTRTIDHANFRPRDLTPVPSAQSRKRTEQQVQQKPAKPPPTSPFPVYSIVNERIPAGRTTTQPARNPARTTPTPDQGNDRGKRLRPKAKRRRRVNDIKNVIHRCQGSCVSATQVIHLVIGSKPPSIIHS